MKERFWRLACGLAAYMITWHVMLHWR